MNKKIIVISFLFLFFSWTLLCTVQAETGSTILRSSSPETVYPTQKRSLVYRVSPKINGAVIQDNEKTDGFNEQIEEENDQIEKMQEEAEDLEKQLKDLEGRGGG